MHDLSSRREKLLADAADCELIACLATEPKKRLTFSRLAKGLKQLADDLEVEIVRREGRDAA